MPTGTISDETVLVKIDHLIGKLMTVHVDKILKAGYARNLSTEDFFHGHFRVADSKMCPENGNFSAQGTQSIYGHMPRDLDKDKWIELFLNSDPHF